MVRKIIEGSVGLDIIVWIPYFGIVNIVTGGALVFLGGWLVHMMIMS